MVPHLLGWALVFAWVVVASADQGWVELDVSGADGVGGNPLVRVGKATIGKQQPNFVVFLVDDLGWGDLGCFGRKNVSTPNIDAMAKEGVKLTQWMSAASICTPSRAALHTGRLPVRLGMVANKLPFRVFPLTASTGGIPDNEQTIGQALRDEGYATAISGKWHLGVSSETRNWHYLPTSKGYDSWLGTPFSNMHACHENPSGGEGKLFCMLMKNTTIVQQPLFLQNLTRELTRHAVESITSYASQSKPFFFLFSFLHVHTPLFSSLEFKGKSEGGAFGDNVEEMDHAVGQVMATIKKLGIDENTLVILTSDNGPYAEEGYDNAGRSGGLKGSKGQTWEGGIRMPGIARWPGHIPAGKVTDTLVGTMDILPTLVSLAGGRPRADLDGRDISEVLFRPDEAKSPHRWMFHYCGRNLAAVRRVAKDGTVLKFHLLLAIWKNKGNSELCTECCPYGTFSAHGKGGSLCDCGIGSDLEDRRGAPVIYDMSKDPGETTPLTRDTLPNYDEMIEEMRSAALNMTNSIQRVPDQMHGISPLNFPCCNGKYVLGASCICNNYTPW